MTDINFFETCFLCTHPHPAANILKIEDVSLPLCITHFNKAKAKNLSDEEWARFASAIAFLDRVLLYKKLYTDC